MMNTSDSFLSGVENRSTIVMKSVNDMIFKGNTIIRQFDDNWQSLAKLITKRFKELAEVAEIRKQELLSQLQEKTLSITTAVQLDIGRCESYLTDIQLQCTMINAAKTNDKFLHEVLSFIDSNLSEIQNATVGLFQVNDIHVDLDYKSPDDIIREHGRILQPSPRHSECSVNFKETNYEITLNTKTSDSQLYPYGGLSASAYFSNSVSQESKDVKAATEVKDNRDGTYLIKLPYDSKYKDSSIIVTLNNQIVAELTELYIMVDQIDTINVIQPNSTVTDVGDELCIKINSSTNLVHVNRDKIYMEYSKIYSDFSNIYNKDSCYLHHNHMTTIKTFSSNKKENFISLFNLNGTLLAQYTAKVLPDIKDVLQAIFIQRGSMKNIVFVNDSPKNDNFYTDDCKIGILNCEDGKIKVKISSQMIALIDVKIIVGDEFIYVTGENKDRLRKILKVYDMNGKLIKTNLFTSKINCLSAKNDIVIVVIDQLIIMYNKDLTIEKCRVTVKYEYDIIGYNIDKVYAISNSQNVLSTWYVPKYVLQ